MKISKYTLFQTSIYIVFFILFSGYYVGLMLWTNLGLGETRAITVPLRLVLLFFLGIAFLFRRKTNFSSPFLLFLLFSALYYIRIFYEMYTGRNNFHISENQFLLYYTAFVFIPFIIISQLKLDVISYHKIIFSILFSTLLLSLFTIYYYSSIIGTVGRISQAISIDENYISPLALSYTGAIGIGLGILFILTNKNLTIKIKLFIFMVIGFSAVPFFLGASRGSIFALALPFILLTLRIKSIKNKMLILIVSVLASFVIVIFSEKFGSSLISRFANIQSDVESGSSSAIRLTIWNDSFKQFLEKPFFGNSLENNRFNSYPHNIFLEVLITTGILGFIPFFVLMYNGLKFSWQILKNNSKYSWVAALFIQSFVQNLFSGGLYSACWLFTSLAILSSVIIFQKESFFNEKQ